MTELEEAKRKYESSLEVYNKAKKDLLEANNKLTSKKSSIDSLSSIISDLTKKLESESRKKEIAEKEYEDLTKFIQTLETNIKTNEISLDELKKSIEKLSNDDKLLKLAVNICNNDDFVLSIGANIMNALRGIGFVSEEVKNRKFMYPYHTEFYTNMKSIDNFKVDKSYRTLDVKNALSKDLKGKAIWGSLRGFKVDNKYFVYSPNRAIEAHQLLGCACVMRLGSPNAKDVYDILVDSESYKLYTAVLDKDNNIICENMESLGESTNYDCVYIDSDGNKLIIVLGGCSQPSEIVAVTRKIFNKCENTKTVELIFEERGATNE